MVRFGMVAVLLGALMGCDDSAPTGTVDDTAPASDTLADTANGGDDVAADTAVAPGPDTAAPPTDTTGGPADTGSPMDTTPGVNPVADQGVRFEIGSFVVQPGTERQVCRTVNLDVDEPLDLVRIKSSMVGTSHHFNLYKVIDSRKFDPVSNNETTVHDCNPADEQLSGDAAYIFGSATPERTFDTPENVAFHLEPGQRLILEQHVINFTNEPIEGGVTVDLFPAGDDADIQHHADIMWFANWGFVLPPNSETSDTAFCTVPYDVEVFGLMSHFHELGTNFVVEAVQDGVSTEVYQDDDWAHPKYQTYSPTISLKQGDGLRWTCTWNNTRSTIVGPNKNSTDEMCITFAAAYPKNTKSGAPIQCNTFF